MAVVVLMNIRRRRRRSSSSSSSIMITVVLKEDSVLREGQDEMALTTRACLVVVLSFAGVSWSQSSQLWYVKAWINGELLPIRSCKDEDEAARAYDAAVKE
jgi:hypothetical protein